MKDSIVNKLDRLKDRFDEIEALLSDAEIISDQTRFRDLSREYAEIEEVVKSFQRFLVVSEDLDGAREIQKDLDPEIRKLAEEEVNAAIEELKTLELALQKLLLPKDSKDSCNVFLEIRAGTGGDEAAIFAGDLYRMYVRYADLQNWRLENITQRHGEHGGYKEIIARIEGKDVYEKLKFESGAHRVQRVPATESQGRIHTSACTVAVLAAAEDAGDIEIRNEDLRIDTYRSSGAGGQHVNTTDSAIRITHLPTNTVVTCQDGRSQHKNREQAMQVLRARLYEQQRDAAQGAEAEARKAMVGSGDRSERIRTYNFPQGRVTDHRIGLTLQKLPQIIAGPGLGELVDALIAEDEAKRLAAMNE